MRKPGYEVCKQQSADQPAHLRSLISAFVFRYLDSIMPILAKSKISRPLLASVTEQAGLSLSWSQPSMTGFLVVQLILRSGNMLR